MKNKKIVLAIIAVIAGIIYLVHRAWDTKDSVQEDKLIGVYVTQKPLETGGSPKTYATKSDEIWYAEDGTPVTSHNYSFDGTEGLRSFTASEKAPKTVTDSTGEFVDDDYITHFSISDMESTSVTSYSRDEKNFHGQITQTELNCYIYAYAGSGKSTIEIYCNPVYQDSDGKVYAVGGECLAVSCDADSAGLSIYSQFENTYTQKHSSGIPEKVRMTVSVHFNVISQPESYTVSQYDASGTLIDSKGYAPGSVPSEIRLLKDCDYAIATETLKNGEVSRTLIDKSTYSFPYYEASDGAFVKRSICELIWP